MNKIMLFFAMGSLATSIYFFFLDKNLFIGSISMILCILFNLAFAMLSNINKNGEKNQQKFLSIDFR